MGDLERYTEAVEELRRAQRTRQQLPRGTPEYARAIDAVLHARTRVWNVPRDQAHGTDRPNR